MPSLTATLRNAELIDGQRVDVQIREGVLTGLQPQLPAGPGEEIDAEGRALSVALKDHHLHLYAAAVAQASLHCGPPHVDDRESLALALAQARPDSQGWIRAIEFHEAHCGELRREDLDHWRSDVPVRVQHASGRKWVLNSAAVERLAPLPWDAAEQARGHLVDQDAWLSGRMRALYPQQLPSLAAVSQQLARYGVVAVTDTTPSNDAAQTASFQAAHRSGELRQRLCVMGQSSLNARYPDNDEQGPVHIGALKIHLLESALPEFGQLCEQIILARAVSRPVAFHCVSRVELVYALAALEQVGSVPGDRIEHAGVCPDDCLQQIRQLGLWVVSQPVFIHDRGDRYRQQVDAEDQPWLYRLQAFAQAGVPLAASSDAPYGDLNPWQGIAAAQQRCTRQGQIIGAAEALDFETALALYQGELSQPGQPAAMRIGEPADICLWQQRWSEIRRHPVATHAALCLQRGQPIWRETV